jgi:hypothetical protein
MPVRGICQRVNGGDEGEGIWLMGSTYIYEKE